MLTTRPERASRSRSVGAAPGGSLKEESSEGTAQDLLWRSVRAITCPECHRPLAVAETEEPILGEEAKEQWWEKCTTASLFTESLEELEEITTVIFLGRSTEAILADARAYFGAHLGRVVVVARDDDNLAPPEGAEVVRASAAAGVFTNGTRKPKYFRVIANGGTSAQQVPTIAAGLGLCLSNGKDRGSADLLEVFDLQRDGVVKKLDQGPRSPAQITPRGGSVV